MLTYLVLNIVPYCPSSLGMSTGLTVEELAAIMPGELYIFKVERRQNPDIDQISEILAFLPLPEALEEIRQTYSMVYQRKPLILKGVKRDA